VYRALQTVLSWYHADAYIEKVHTVLELQKVLKEVEDKPEDFVGGRDTLGAFEAGAILKKLLEVKRDF
jgi:hypothetical protein